MVITKAHTLRRVEIEEMEEVDGAGYISSYKNLGFIGFPEEIRGNILIREWHEPFFHLEKFFLPEL